ncbi:MAG TPA: 5-bromo-4-chloroindolyl phosphate hydrolysis family protein [Candidatus Faecalibacterium faecigallinarum]|uniref:5-bromo-4-chloroindolyl phosphate hydrolysis family protein n=1 Tax=Candidatus Faecalibacterium faecigallinarum TaxID=2838577 RepID=A0A9D2P6Y2_9FIRM|nr:5-bromo-4-chloroindolyl phosphate hydrolysis family protein [Candidatus Faecalibacterium faecigallinarum]
MPQHKHYFARIPLIALLVLLGLAPWLAVILFILRAVDKDAEKKEWRAFQDRRRYAADFRPEDTRRAAQPGPGAPYDYSARYQAHDLPTAEQQKAKKRRQSLINWCTVLGGLFLFAGVTSLPDSIYYGLWNDLFSNLFMVVGGGGALVLGLFLRRVSRLERQLDKVVGDRDNIPLDELFAAAGIPEKEGRKVLESAIDHGYFGADAYIDNRTDFLVVRGDAPIPAPPAQESAPQPDPDPAGESQYQRLLRQLHEAGAALADPVLRDKAARLETVSARIFALAEADPGKEDQLRKFVNYYLPTALKLLHTYAQLDGQGVDGENITKTKQSIERSLDLLVTAFENQLDKLFQSDALDVSADIAALEGMLNLDGLSGESDFTSQ